MSKKKKQELKNERANRVSGIISTKHEKLKHKHKKKKRKKMSDMSSEVSSSISSNASVKSGAAVSQSSSGSKKSQCDLCKLSYSSDKELTEHLVSLMHHTKLENKQPETNHFCNVCKAGYDNMAEYRKHIANRFHLDNLARFKGEFVPSRKPKKSRWNDVPKASSGKHYDSHSNQSWTRRREAQGNPAFRPPMFNPQVPPPYYDSWTNHGRGPSRSREDLFDQRDGYNDFSYPSNWCYEREQRPGWNQDTYYPNARGERWTADNPYMNGKDKQFYNQSRGYQAKRPWGSGFQDEHWGGGVYEHSGPGRNLSQHGTSGENQVDHWDEQSLRMQEQFLASMEDAVDLEGPTERRGSGNKHWNKSRGSYETYDVERQSEGLLPTPNSESRLQTDFDYQGGTINFADRKRPVPDGGHDDRLNTAARKSSRPVRDHLSPANPSMKDGRPLTGGQCPPSSIGTNSVSQADGDSSASLNQVSDDLLQKAERLCQELREKRLASGYTHSTETQARGSSSTTPSHSRFSSSINQHALPQRKRTSLLGDYPSSGDRSGDSGISVSTSEAKGFSGKTGPKQVAAEMKKRHASAFQGQRSWSEMRKSLDGSDKMEAEPVQKINGTVASRIRRDSNGPLVLSPRERRDSGSGGRQAIKPGQFTRDSLKKMINAPRSRDQRVHLAKLLQSRDDTHGHKPATGAANSARPLQLEGLYDSELITAEAAAEMSTSTNGGSEAGKEVSTIKLEDLGEDVRQQILSLIGPDLVGLGSIQLSKSDKQSVLISSDENDTPVVSRTEKSDKTKKILGSDTPAMKKKKNKLLNNARKESVKKGESKTASGALNAARDRPEIERAGNHSLCARGSVPSRLGADLVVIDSGDEEKSWKKSVSTGRSKYSVKPVAEAVNTEILPAKKKKKKKKAGNGKEYLDKEVSSSFESDDVLKRSQPPERDLNYNGTRKLPLFGISGSKHNEHPQKDLSVKSAPSVIASATIYSTNSEQQLHSLNQDQSLNSENVRKRFPIMMGSMEKPKSSSTAKSPKISQTSSADSSSAFSKSSSFLSHTAADTSYAKAVPMSVSTAATSPSVSVLFSTSPPISHTLDIDHSSMTVNSAERASLDLHLPPSIHLSKPVPSSSQASSPTLVEQQPGSAPLDINRQAASTKTINHSESCGDVRLEVPACAADTVVDIVDSCGGEEDDDRASSTACSSALSGDASEAAMQELLRLSEREEHVRQESMNLELRLTRLHRLLEQAVVQINRCTQRRSQLQEEEKEISTRRLALLREAAKGKGTSSKSSTTSSQNHGAGFVSSGTSTTTTTLTASSAALTTAATISTSASPPPSTSLSKADWLAKFASFLPLDPTLDQERQSLAGRASSASLGVSNTSKSVVNNMNTDSRPGASEPSELTSLSLVPQTSGLTQDTGGDASGPIMVENRLMSTSVTLGSTLNNEVDANLSSNSQKRNSCLLSGSVDKIGSETRAETLPSAARANVTRSLSADNAASTSSAPTSVAMMHLPYQYLGSFRTLTTNKSNPIVRSILLNQESREAGPDVISLPEPHAQASHAWGGGEDSDWGSVASSRASGASLGEQIMHYCRSTPDACLDSQRPQQTYLTPAGDLTVILSSDASGSEHHSNIRGAEEDETEISDRNVEAAVVRPCSVMLHRLPTATTRGLCGDLDEEAVRSAEVQHLAERSRGQELQQDQGSKLPELEDIGVTGRSDEVKRRKKLLTRQEREASRLTRHRQRRMVISSSTCSSGASDGEVEGSREEGEGDRAKENKQERKRILAEAAKLRERGLSTSDNLSSGDKVTKMPAMTSSMIKAEQQENPSSIVVAECDSSTGVGLVDTQSLLQRTQILCDMRDSFERTFGRSPRKLVTGGKDTSQGINSTTSDPSLEAQVGLTGQGTLDSSVVVLRTPLGKHHGTDAASSRESLSTAVSPEERKATGLRRFIGSEGLVCEMQVVSGHLYIGYQYIGITVFDLDAPSEDKISEHAFDHLECFFVIEIDGILTVIVGNGNFLVFCRASDNQVPPKDLGTPIYCIQYSEPDIFLGLDTGEISVYSAKTLEEKSRFICSRRHIISMALGQEGATRLLCASAADGTISVLDAHQGLPLRIIGGYDRIACSLQVNKSLVYSGSVDGSLQAHNIHTCDLEKDQRDHSGALMAVHVYQDYLFTGGLDRLVRCYNIKTGELIQVLYGAGKGPISKITFVDNKLIIGNMFGMVDSINFDITARNECHVNNCGLNFGNALHFQWHLSEEHMEECKPTVDLTLLGKGEKWMLRY